MWTETDFAAAVKAIRGACYRPLSATERDFFVKHLSTLVTRIDAAIAREVASILKTD